MKSFKITFSVILALIIGIILTSCSKKIDGVETSLNLVARRTEITVVAEFTDSESRVFKEITPVAYIYELENGKESNQIASETLELEDDADVAVETRSNPATFDDLDENTEYLIKVMANYNSYNYTLASEKVSTNDKGSSVETAIEIDSVEDFAEMRYDSDGYYKLVADVDFGGEELAPMFTTSSTAFTGHFDGNNFALKNYVMTSNNQYNGLFAYNKGEIKNLTIENATIKTSRSSEINTGLLVGRNEGVIDGITVKKSTVEVICTTYSLDYSLYVGGLVGYCDGNVQDIKVINSTLEDVTINVKPVLKGRIGGLIGEVALPANVRKNPTIENNVVKTTITVEQEIKSSTKTNVEIYVGGLVGVLGRNIEKCYAESTIKVTTKKNVNATYENGLENYTLGVGGLVGYMAPNSIAKVSQSVFKGSIEVGMADTDKQASAYSTYVGGLVGIASDLYKGDPEYRPTSLVEHSVAIVSKLSISVIAELPGVETPETTLLADETTEEGNTEDGNTEEEVVEYETYTVGYGLVFGDYQDAEQQDSLINHVYVKDALEPVYAGFTGDAENTVTVYGYNLLPKDLTGLGFDDFVISKLQ